MADEPGLLYEAELRKAQARIKVLEQVIFEDLEPFQCSDDLNRMIVENIIERKERVTAERVAARNAHQ